MGSFAAQAPGHHLQPPPPPRPRAPRGGPLCRRPEGPSTVRKVKTSEKLQRVILKQCKQTRISLD